MKNRQLLLPLLGLFALGTSLTAEARAAEVARAASEADRTADTTVFALLDLTRPGLERVDSLHAAGNDPEAARALLAYYRSRTGVRCPEVNLDSVTLSPDEQRWADEALEHRFFVHTGYQPSYFYGDDIDWQYWPVRDNELRWQLHRMKWWVPMGKTYRLSSDERYAKEWCAEYLDWIRKNPLGPYDESSIGDWNRADNVYFAWRPLEVSDRLEFQIHQFLYFLPAEAFDGEFLLQFLRNYHRHAQHILGHFSASGNHLLFQAQRLLFAGAFFPEFRDAVHWRSTGVGILNREIEKQVYDDGMQYELDPHYHLESINIFFKALRMMDANGYRGEFPASYLATVERMIDVHLNCLYPDYTTPLFSDNREQDKAHLLASYAEWLEVFPDNDFIRYCATRGRQGARPDYLSRAFRTSGFYVLRNGWDTESTVMILKAGPQAFWHCQPDNGTFELWHRGRNFFPDSGCYVYAGDREVNDQRAWFRQTRVHNTLTLDNRNLEVTDSKRLLWKTSPEQTVLVTENPSYEGLTHRRAFFATQDGLLVIVDVARGEAAGTVGVHFNLCPGEITFAKDGTLRTLFDDANNIRIKSTGCKPLRIQQEEGWVSSAYRKKEQRPAYAVEMEKAAGEELWVVTVITPEDPERSGSIAIVPDRSSTADRFQVAVRVGARTYDFRYEL